MGLINLFRWLRGYVVVRSKDENITQFINLLLKRRIKIWNIKKNLENPLDFSGN